MGRAKHTINGQTALSATTLPNYLNSGWKEFWFRKTGFEECDRVRDESTVFGKKVHNLVEKYLRGEVYELLPDDRPSVCAGMLIDWCKQAQVKPLILPAQFGEKAGQPAMEFKVEDEELLMVGHPDLICTFGDNPTPWILDWKTSKKFDPAYIMQATTYAKAWFMMTGQKINDAAILRVDKDPTLTPQFETEEIHDIFEKYVPVLRDAKNVYDFFEERGKWKKPKKEKTK